MRSELENVVGVKNHQETKEDDQKHTQKRYIKRRIREKKVGARRGHRVNWESERERERSTKLFVTL